MGRGRRRKMATRMQEMVRRLAGLSGVVLIAASVAGLVSTQLQDEAPAKEEVLAGPEAVAPVQTHPDPMVAATPDTVQATVDTVQAARISGPHDHYPLQVGRFWVYRYQEPDSDVVTEVERVIVRREPRADGKELFIFDDGGVVYYEDGKVFEMGSSGGVNIIPVDTAGTPPPVVYRSQGMQIEKWFGAVDTSLVVAGHRFDDCLEVVTRFRAVESGTRQDATSQGSNPQGSVSYSSFYAPGIGMIGRQSWPRDEQGTLTVTLADHGTRQL